MIIERLQVRITMLSILLSYICEYVGIMRVYWNVNAKVQTEITCVTHTACTRCKDQYTDVHYALQQSTTSGPQREILCSKVILWVLCDVHGDTCSAKYYF